MEQATKDLVDMVSKSVAAAGVLIAAWNLRRSALIRRDDLRWRAATGAHDALADIHHNEWAVQAVGMIDCHLAGDTYDAPDSALGCRGVTVDRIGQALAGHRLDDASKYIFKCFDWFLYYLDRIAYLEKERLIRLADVETPLAPYAVFLNAHWSLFEGIAREHGYASVGLLVAKLADRRKVV